MTKEMTARGRAYHTYRYRRFQALDDALTMYFHLKNAKAWVDVTDLCTMMEWDSTNHSVRKRVRRICGALERVNRIQVKRVNVAGSPMFIRSLE